MSQSISTPGVEITKAIPASADAAALGKYGSIPVSPYTGVPNISIPLYTIKSGDIMLPISLSYHSGGIKAEEMASSVGLGWSLNAGGVITRTIRGMADEATYGILDPMHYIPNLVKWMNNDPSCAFSQTDANSYMNALGMGTIDGQPDIYNYNFGTYSGKFVMDSYGNITTIPHQNIIFHFTQSNNRITYFTAQTPDGIVYSFGSPDGTTAIETTKTSTDPHAVPYCMSWFMSKITSPSLHEIDFNYVSDTYTQGQVPSQTDYTWVSGADNTPRNDPPAQYLNSSITFNTVRLNTITFENGTLSVAANNTRLDLNCKYINAISIQSGAFSKVYNLYYFNSANSRLRLDSLVGQLEPFGSNNYKREKYSFQYNGDSWQPQPSNYAFSQDWWGYSNGQGNVVNGVATLLPAMNINVLGTAVALPGANRSSDQSSMESGMLTQITYPTGGHTSFTYESNHEANVDLGGTSADYPPTPALVYMSNDPSSMYYNNQHSMALHITSSAPGVPQAVSVQVSGMGTAYEVSCAIADSTGTTIGQLWNTTTTDSAIYLMPGNYTFVIHDPKGYTDPTKFTNYDKYAVAAWWNTPNPGLRNNFVVGGLRIKQIADYDGISSKAYNVRTYKYTMPNSSTSSGFLSFQPAYSYQLEVNQIVQNGTIGQFLYQNNYLTRTAVSNYPLATTQGEVVGYSYVQELIGGSGESGRNDYFYTTAADYPDLKYDQGFPFSPPVDQDWKRGLLKEETNYKYVNGTYLPLKDKICTYNTIQTTQNVGIKAGFNPKPAGYDPSLTYLNTTPQTGDGELFETTYYDESDFTYLSADITKIYNSSDPTKFILTTTNYQYDPSSYLIRQVQTTNSKKENIIQKVTYPFDYSTFGTPTGSLLGIQNLTNMGISSYPIEVVTQKSNADGSNLRTIKAVLSTYKTNKPYRDSVYELNSIAPVTNFVTSSPGTNNIAKDSHYQPVVSFDSYDAYGNILQEKQIGNAVHSYLWGYANSNYPENNTYPTAEIINANNSDVAYTNFESYDFGGTGSGSWVYPNTTTVDATAPMGANCFTVSNAATLTRSGLNSSITYIVSFWAKSGAAITVAGGTVTNISTGNAKSGWYYHEYNVTGTTSVTIGGTGPIDEVRLYPLTAQMSTYTYMPLVGISSKCDIRNNITYYNFDNVGRLTQVQDQNRNIVKGYQYNYTNQGPVWADNGTTRCVTDTYGNYTGEEQMQQIDTNPYSSSYNQTQWRSMGQQPGACPITQVYVNMKLASTTTSKLGVTTNTYEIDTYSDANFSIPYTVSSNLNVNYQVVVTNTSPSGTTTTSYTAVVTAGNNKVTTAPITMNSCSTCSSVVTLLGGVGYNIPQY